MFIVLNAATQEVFRASTRTMYLLVRKYLLKHIQFFFFLVFLSSFPSSQNQRDVCSVTENFVGKKESHTYTWRSKDHLGMCVILNTYMLFINNIPIL